MNTKSNENFKITFGEVRDKHLKKLEKLTKILNRLEDELKLNEFNVCNITGKIEQVDVLLLIFQMNLVYNFDTKNADSKAYIKEYGFVKEVDKKTKEENLVFKKIQNAKYFFEKNMYSNDFFELNCFLTRFDEEKNEEFQMTKEAKNEYFYIKKDNYMHFILALLFNLRKIHKEEKISYDKCFKTYEFADDSNFNDEYQQLKSDVHKYLMPIKSEDNNGKRYYDYTFFKDDDNCEQLRRFEFIKDVESIVYDLHFLRKEMLIDFNINFSRNEVSNNLIKVTIENMKQLIVLAYSCEHTTAFVQKIQNIKTSQIWGYDNKTHCYSPLNLEEFILKFKNKFRSVIVNSIYNEKDSKTNKALRFITENSLQQYFTNDNNTFIRIKDRRKTWCIAFNNGLLEIDKTMKNTYKFSESFDKSKLCLLSFNFDFNQKEFEYLLKHQDENKFVKFLSYFVKEIRDEKSNINQDRLDFLLSCIANHYEFDEDFHATTNFIGTRGTGKSQLLNMLTQTTHKTKTLSTDHSAFDYEKDFFNADTALTCLYAFKSESSIKDFTDNSNAKSAIAREFVSVNRKFEDERNVEVQTKFMTFAENEPKIKHDGGLFERSLYFYVNEKKEDLYKEERYSDDNNGSMANVINKQPLGLICALYQAVQYQTQHIFGHGARRYKELYRKLFTESTQKSLENTNTEAQKILEIVDITDSFAYEKDLITMYKLVANSNISNEITTNVTNKTIKSYIRQLSENYQRNVKYDRKLSNDKFGIKKGNNLILGVAINRELVAKLKTFYSNKKNTVAVEELQDIENNIKELYTSENVVENLYRQFKIELLNNDNADAKQKSVKKVFDDIDDLYSNSKGVD